MYFQNLIAKVLLISTNLNPNLKFIESWPQSSLIGTIETIKIKVSSRNSAWHPYTNRIERFGNRERLQVLAANISYNEMFAANTSIIYKFIKQNFDMFRN